MKTVGNIAVGTPIAGRPPHRSGQARFRHPAPDLGCLTSKRTSGLAVRGPAPGSRAPGSVSGACFADPRSPWSPALAPPAPQPVARLRSSASLLLCRSSDFSGSCIGGYGSSPSRHGPHDPTGLMADPEISRFPRKERPYMPGSKTTPGRSGARVSAPVRIAFR